MDPIMVQNMDPEVIAQLMELGIIPGQIEEHQQNILRQQGLQDAPGPQGRSFREGIYQAANPLEHLGSTIGKFKARENEQNARRMAQILRDKQATGRQQFLDSYLNRGTPGTNPMAAMLRGNPHAGGY